MADKKIKIFSTFLDAKWRIASEVSSISTLSVGLLLKIINILNIVLPLVGAKTVIPVISEMEDQS